MGCKNINISCFASFLCHVKCPLGTDINQAALILGEGGLVAIPTETVYGLAANALNRDAVARIFEAKNRPTFDPLIVHCANFEMVSRVVKHFPEPLKPLVEQFWPGPLTVVVDKSPEIPDLVTSGLPTVGIRIPNHPLTLNLLQKLDFPIAAPSANPFTYVSPTSAKHVAQQLGNKIDYILDGGVCSVGLESTIVRHKNDRIEVLRLGGLSIEEIQSVSPLPVEIISGKDNVSVPGNFKKHYSNAKEIVIAHELPPLKHSLTQAWLFFSKPENADQYTNCFYLTESDDLREAASNLFKVLRDLDQPGLEVIYAQWAPHKGLGLAINDRLTRASAK